MMRGGIVRIDFERVAKSLVGVVRQTQSKVNRSKLEMHSGELGRGLLCPGKMVEGTCPLAFIEIEEPAHKVELRTQGTGRGFWGGFGHCGKLFKYPTTFSDSAQCAITDAQLLGRFNSVGQIAADLLQERQGFVVPTSGLEAAGKIQFVFPCGDESRRTRN
jgi:hypothetical protein